MASGQSGPPPSYSGAATLMAPPPPYSGAASLMAPPPPYPDSAARMAPPPPYLAVMNDSSNSNRFSGVTYSDSNQLGQNFTCSYGLTPTTHSAADVHESQPSTSQSQAFRYAADQILFHYDPQICDCPHCQTRIITELEFKNGTYTWFACFYYSVIGLCLLPFCINHFKDRIHVCPNCKEKIARFRPFNQEKQDL